MPTPCALRTRKGMICALGATPAIPMPLSVLAAITPVTAHPCPNSSCGVPSSSKKSQPASMRPSRSGWSAQTPLSITATVTVDGSSSSSLHTCGAPKMGKAHCSAKSGSSGGSKSSAVR